MLKKSGSYHRKFLESSTQSTLRAILSNISIGMLFAYFKSLKASNGWLEKFKNRHSLTFCVLSGENAQVNPITVEEWKRRLPILFDSYAQADIYSADETSLFFKLLPNRSMVISKDICEGGKRSKERYTILLCSNWWGHPQLKPLVIGMEIVSTILTPIILLSM